MLPRLGSGVATKVVALQSARLPPDAPSAEREARMDHEEQGQLMDRTTRNSCGDQKASSMSLKWFLYVSILVGKGSQNASHI